LSTSGTTGKKRAYKHKWQQFEDPLTGLPTWLFKICFQPWFLVGFVLPNL
jgi:hypothetical protein